MCPDTHTDANKLAQKPQNILGIKYTLKTTGITCCIILWWDESR